MRFALCLLLSLILHAFVAWRILSFVALECPPKLEHAPIVLSIAEIEDERAPLRELETLAEAAMSEVTQVEPDRLLLACAPSPESIPLEFDPPEAPAPKFEAEVKVELASAPEQAAVEGTGPEAERTIVPKYPRGARRRGEEGEVLLKLEIDVAGVVKAAAVIDSSGFPELDSAAVNAAMGAKFKPAFSEGSAIPSVLSLKFAFKLK